MNILAIGFKNVPFFQNDVRKCAEARGYVMDFCRASALTIDVRPRGVQILAEGFDVSTYDVIHVGAIASNRWAVIAAVGYLRKTYGCTVIDRRLVTSTLDQYSSVAKYFLEYEHGIALPRSIQFKQVSEIAEQLTEFTFPVVVKTNNSKQGRGVGIAHAAEDIERFVQEHLAIDDRTGFILREYIPNDGDYRVNVIGGKAVVCLKRTPKPGEFRSNISLGGTLSRTILEDVKEICAAGEKIARLADYDIAGVDVMVHGKTGIPHILEVNRIPGNLEDDVEVSGVDIAKLIVDLYERRSTHT